METGAHNVPVIGQASHVRNNVTPSGVWKLVVDVYGHALVTGPKQRHAIRRMETRTSFPCPCRRSVRNNVTPSGVWKLEQVSRVDAGFQSETTSRHQAYGNLDTRFRLTLGCCARPKQRHAIRRMETRRPLRPGSARRTSETTSRHQAYGNVAAATIFSSIAVSETTSRHQAYGNF